MKKVSVFFITYNHEKYVATALESIVTQKVNFDFELIIGEDCSTDKTRAICEDYAARYPHIIRLLPSDRNYGPMNNALRVFHECKGEYVAVCEGDDYWTDTNKLQRQVDFLDANPDYAMCFTGVEVRDEMGWNYPQDFYFPAHTKDTYTIEDLILSDKVITPTATLLFRNVLPDPFPEFFRHTFSGDLFLQMLAADKGKVKYLDTKMAVYRNHSGGLSKSPAQAERTNNSIKQLYLDANKYFNYKYDAVIRRRIFELSKVRLIFGAKEKKGLDRVKHYFNVMPDYLKYSKGINIKEIIYYHLILFFPSLLKKLGRK
jgi:glycosyltransferase involved in cell wall biosynthesis